jgi:hypothetical protein
VNAKTKKNFEKLWGGGEMEQYAAFDALIKETDGPVDWAYEKWDELVDDLTAKDPHRRARATQLLCGLAKSDPKGRMLKDFDAVMAVTRDEKFVTARHTLQAAWKVGLAGSRQRQLVLDRLAARFADCVDDEKHCTLIRYDIEVGLRQLYDATGDESVKTKALALIETETDAKYKKKYTAEWRKKT